MAAAADPRLCDQVHVNITSAQPRVSVASPPAAPHTSQQVKAAVSDGAAGTGAVHTVVDAAVVASADRDDLKVKDVRAASDSHKPAAVHSSPQAPVRSFLAARLSDAQAYKEQRDDNDALAQFASVSPMSTATTDRHDDKESRDANLTQGDLVEDCCLKDAAHHVAAAVSSWAAVLVLAACLAVVAAAVHHSGGRSQRLNGDGSWPVYRLLYVLAVLLVAVPVSRAAAVAVSAVLSVVLRVVLPPREPVAAALVTSLWLSVYLVLVRLTLGWLVPGDVPTWWEPIRTQVIVLIVFLTLKALVKEHVLLSERARVLEKRGQRVLARVEAVQFLCVLALYKALGPSQPLDSRSKALLAKMIPMRAAGHIVLLNSQKQLYVAKPGNATAPKRVAHAVFRHLGYDPSAAISDVALASIIRSVWTAPGKAATAPPDVKDCTEQASLVVNAITNFVDTSFRMHTLVEVIEEALRGARLFQRINNEDSTLLQAVDVLATCVVVVAQVIAAIVAYDLELFPVLTTVSALLISISFAFGHTAQEVVTGLTFILLRKPYDIGDRVKLSEGDNGYSVYVHRTGVFFTQFRSLGGVVFDWPNSKLATMRIENHSRSVYTSIEIKLDVGHRTTHKQLENLTHAVASYLRSRTDAWKKDGLEFYVYSIGHNHLEVAFWVVHVLSWEYALVLWADLSNLRLFIQRAMLELGIEVVQTTQPLTFGGTLDAGPSGGKVRPRLDGHGNETGTGNGGAGAGPGAGAGAGAGAGRSQPSFRPGSNGTRASPPWTFGTVSSTSDSAPRGSDDGCGGSGSGSAGSKSGDGSVSGSESGDGSLRGSGARSGRAPTGSLLSAALGMPRIFTDFSSPSSPDIMNRVQLFSGYEYAAAYKDLYFGPVAHLTSLHIPVERRDATQPFRTGMQAAPMLPMLQKQVRDEADALKPDVSRLMNRLRGTLPKRLREARTRLKQRKAGAAVVAGAGPAGTGAGAAVAPSPPPPQQQSSAEQHK